MLHLMFAAALASTTPPAAKPAASLPLAEQLKADQKFGCAVLFVGADEVFRRNPALLSQLAEGEGEGAGAKAIGPLLKMMGASGEAILNATIAEGVAKGEKPSAIYRRGISSVASLMIDAPVTKTGAEANEERGVALFTGCLSVMSE